MICPNCNSNIDDNVSSCPECGAAISQNINFNNYFPQDNLFDNNYQNSQNYQQNNFGGAYPNSDYYNQQQYTPTDAGESNASTSQICGILSLFLGPILAIISLVFASKYKKVGNGQNASRVKVGKICSWISIISHIAFALLVILSFWYFVSYSISSNGESFIDYEAYEDMEDDRFYENSSSPDIQSEYINFSDTEDIYYSVEDEYYADDEQSEIILYEKLFPAGGKVIYDKDGIKLTLTEFYFSEDTSIFFQEFNMIIATELSENYDIVCKEFFVDGEKFYGGAFYSQDAVQIFTYPDIDNIEYAKEVILVLMVEDAVTDEELFPISFTIPLNKQ